VAGIDCSTQSTKVVVREAGSGTLVAKGRAPHPAGTEVDPACWWEALDRAASGLLGQVSAVSVGAQQHGMVCLDDRGEVVRPALLWNDTRSAGAAADLTAELGGPAAWAEAVGSVPLASFTVAKLRWLADHEPELAGRVALVVLPHDWLTWRLAGRSMPPVTDRGDASGTGYWSPRAGCYRRDLLALAFGRPLDVPDVAGSSAVVATTGAGGPGGLPPGVAIAAGTGDNMAAALGVGAGPGDVVVSVGTSGTIFAVHAAAVADASGTVAGFADATGRFLPLVCTLNAARVLETVAGLLGVDLAALDDLALSAPAGAGGLTLLPYLEGERTPNRPDAAGVLAGLRGDNLSPANLARAAVEGMLCGMADGLDALRAFDVEVRRVLLIGGGARSRAVRAIAPAILGAPVTVPPPSEYVADGAARQAAWALGGGDEPPGWEIGTGTMWEADPDPAVRSAYAELRDAAPAGSARPRPAAPDHEEGAA